MQDCRSRNRPDTNAMKPSACVRVTAAAGLLVIGLASCSSGDESPKLTATGSPGVPAITGATHADVVKRWRTQAQPSMDKMNDALVWFEGAVKSSDYTDARAACRSFGTSVDSLERQLPAPDDGVTAVIREAVSHFRDFVRECLTVNPEMTQDEANLVVSLRDQGIERIKAAVDMMDRIEQQ
jgi:hypothetical protein